MSKKRPKATVEILESDKAVANYSVIIEAEMLSEAMELCGALLGVALGTTRDPAIMLASISNVFFTAMQTYVTAQDVVGDPLWKEGFDA